MHAGRHQTALVREEVKRDLPFFIHYIILSQILLRWHPPPSTKLDKMRRLDDDKELI